MATSMRYLNVRSVLAFISQLLSGKIFSREKMTVQMPFLQNGEKNVQQHPAEKNSSSI